MNSHQIKSVNLKRPFLLINERLYLSCPRFEFSQVTSSQRLLSISECRLTCKMHIYLTFKKSAAIIYIVLAAVAHVETKTPCPEKQPSFSSLAWSDFFQIYRDVSETRLGMIDFYHHHKIRPDFTLHIIAPEGSITALNCMLSCFPL